MRKIRKSLGINQWETSRMLTRALNIPVGERQIGAFENGRHKEMSSGLIDRMSEWVTKNYRLANQTT